LGTTGRRTLGELPRHGGHGCDEPGEVFARDSKALGSGFQVDDDVDDEVSGREFD
jgi:hypothetical protein